MPRVRGRPQIDLREQVVEGVKTIDLAVRFNSRDGARNRINHFGTMRADGTFNLFRFYPSQMSHKIAHWLGVWVRLHNQGWLTHQTIMGEPGVETWTRKVSDSFELRTGPISLWVPKPVVQPPSIALARERIRALPALVGDQRAAEVSFRDALLSIKVRGALHPGVLEFVVGRRGSCPTSDAAVRYVTATSPQQVFDDVERFLHFEWDTPNTRKEV